MGRIDVCIVCAFSVVVVESLSVGRKTESFVASIISFRSVEKFAVLFAMNCLVPFGHV